MLQIRSKNRSITILTHLLIWAVFGLAIFFRQPVFFSVEFSNQLWIKQTVTFGLLILAFYFNSSLLVPRLLLRNHTAYYFVTIIAIIVAIAFSSAWVDLVFRTGRRGAAQLFQPRHFMPSSLNRHLDSLTIIISALVLVIGMSITLMQKWQKDKQEREILEKEKISSELSFLKAQINPHFFFNTLNNIYALTQTDGNEAGKAVHQLSRMMRYLLYETQQGQTRLSQEIALVKDYIGLMQLRMTGVAHVTVDTPTSLADRPMAPMVLLPFVENAFKHGVSATQQSHVGILILQAGDMLDITVKNSIVKNNSISLDHNSGIGLANTRRRLELLYPDKYKLDICELNASDEYSVHLMLDLS